MDSNSDLKNNSNVGVLLVSHGSSLPISKETFTEIRDKYIDLTGINAEVGYMKVEKPSLTEAIDILNKEGNLNKIIAMPVFLAPGIHTRIDIPTILGLDPLEEDPRCPDGNYPKGHYLYGLKKPNFDGSIELLSPIGPDDDLLPFINKSVDAAIDSSKLGLNAKTGILLVSHGSRLRYNKEFISALHEKYAATVDYPTNFGFMELVGPSIPEAINTLYDNNSDIERLIVVPVFISPGVHTTRDIPTILGLIESKHGHNHSHSHEHSHGHDHHNHHHDDVKLNFDGEILYCDPIGSDDILIGIIEKNVKNAL